MTFLSEQQRESGLRALVIKEARKWIGTPYKNCGDVLGVGVDCGMLLVRVFVDTGLCAKFDPRPYPIDWHLHRSEEKYLGFIFDRCAEVEKPQPGDVIVFKLGRTYSHGGIVTCTDPLTLIHAYWPVKRVLEQVLAQDVQLSDPKRVHKFFSYWKRA